MQGPRSVQWCEPEGATACVAWMRLGCLEHYRGRKALGSTKSAVAGFCVAVKATCFSGLSNQRACGKACGVNRSNHSGGLDAVLPDCMNVESARGVRRPVPGVWNPRRELPVCVCLQA
jgi:hypothetical protein